MPRHSDTATPDGCIEKDTGMTTINQPNQPNKTTKQKTKQNNKKVY